MSKTLDAISEIVRDTRSPLHKADDRPVKAQNTVIQLGDWAEQRAG